MPTKAKITSKDWVRVLSDCFASDMVELREKAAQEAIQCQSLKVASILERQLKREPSSLVRSYLVISLAVCGRGRNLKTIVETLEDEDDRVRANTLKALKPFVDQPGVIPHIIRHILDDAEEVRSVAREALHRIKPSVLVQTVRLMLQHPKAEYRASALHFLKLSYDTRVYAMTWAGDQARSAIPTLRGMSDREAVALVKRLIDDTHKDVSEAARSVVPQMAAAGIAEAQEILAELKEQKASVSPAQGEDGTGTSPLETARTMLNHPIPEVRLARVRKIVNEADVAYLRLLRERCQVETDQLVLRHLLEALGKMGGEAERDLIVSRLRARSEGVRLAGIEALGRLGAAPSLTELQGMLDDSNHRVRAAAAVVLSNDSLMDPQSYLTEIVEVGGRDNLLTALTIIRQMPKPSEYHELLAKIHDQTEDKKVKSFAQEVESSLCKTGKVKERKVTGHFKWSLEELAKQPSRVPEDIRQYLAFAGMALAIGYLIYVILFG